MNDLLSLHVVPDLRIATGGIAAVVPVLCERLRENGIESRIVTFAQDESNILADRTTVLAERSPWALIRRLRSETARLRIEASNRSCKLVCHSHGVWSFINHGLAVAARADRIPLIVSPHGMLLRYARRHKALRKTLAWRLYQARDMERANVVHVTSPEERLAAEEEGVCSPFAVIPFGVDLPNCEAKGEAPKTDSDATAQVGTLLFLGRIHPIKNIESLVEGFARAKLSNWRLRIVGPDDGGHSETLRRLAQGLGIGELVSFEGPVFDEAKAQLLKEVDVLVLPSHSENFGVVVAEALASGIPAIASTGTPWSTLESRGCGWWVLPTPDYLATALRSASSIGPEKLRAMGIRGRNYVKTHLAWPRCTQRMASLYRNLVAENGDSLIERAG